MTEIGLKITLLEPTLVISLGSGDANQQNSFDYIPGSVLRSSLAAAYIKQNHIKDEDVQTDDHLCRRLFFDDKVRFLNAYPVSSHNERSLPVPLSWRAVKNALAEFDDTDDTDWPLDIYDFSQAHQELDSPKPLNKLFWRLSAQKVEFVGVKKQIMVHNQRTTRRVMAKNSSGVFQYQALAAGETFIGIILVDDSVSVESIKALFGEMSIGKSRSAGYGRVTIEDISTVIDRKKWVEPSWSEAEIANRETVVITLLSDALVRDEHGGYTTDISPLVCKNGQTADKENAPSLSVDAGSEAGRQPEPTTFERAYLKTSLIGGFNRKWGLPLPQVQAIKMGSVYRFEKEKIDLEKLKGCQQKGIGERRGEGFGRIAVNWHPSDTLEARKTTSRKIADEITAFKNDHASQLAQRIVQSQLRRTLDQQLLGAIANSTINPSPSKSQLSRIRLAARKALEKKALGPINNFLDSACGGQRDEQRKKACHELRQKRVKIFGETLSLYDWLEQSQAAGYLDDKWTLTQPSLSELLKTKEEEVKLPIIKQIFAKKATEVYNEYTARLIEGVVKKKLDELRQEGE